jgi:hypothetical protein
VSNILGSMHFDLSSNSDVGGTIMSKNHIDGVIMGRPSMSMATSA